MTLQLDDRQRAMLQEMGVRVFATLRPASAPAQPPVPVRASPMLSAPPPQARSMPAPVVPAMPPSQHSEVALLDWDALGQAVATCSSCANCPQKGATVFGAGGLRPEWLVVGDPPDEMEAREGEPFAGECGALLNNMLRAVGVARNDKAYLTNITKCRPPGSRNVTREEMAQCEPVLRRQVELLKPKVILLMGRFAVPSLLQTTEPLGKLRGRVHEYLGIPVVVTYHPSYLLRNPADKANAWADLCLAKELVIAGARAP